MRFSHLKQLWLSLLLLTLAGCASRPAGTAEETPPVILENERATGRSYGRSEYGHRPGPRGFKTVVIDAGHGGRDNGAVSRYTGEKEKNLTLDTAQRLARNLSGNFKIVMIRSGDKFVDLNERVALANRYSDAILISIHFNSGAPGLRGPETFYWRVDSHGLAVRFQRAMSQVSPGKITSRGLTRRRLRLTRNPMIPCVLVEGGYLSNKTDSLHIRNAKYRQALADALAHAIRTQSAMGDEGTGPLPKPINAPISRATDRPE